MPPVGVLIPTRNSMAFLPHHVGTMRGWLDLAQEIVVVDSESRDGTTEFLRKMLPADKTRFFSRPPGLYQAWNFGVRQIGAQYTYVSTIGDEIDREGFAHLVEVAERLACDVVISPPAFVAEDGRPVRANPWPVHEIISFWNLEGEICIEGMLLFAMALSFLPFALLGSSASNLYRTEVLQENPFPTEFGRNGDGAWGFLNALDIRLGITPRRVSSFRKHQKTYRNGEYATEDPDQRMLAAGLKRLEETFELRPEMKVDAAHLGLENFIRQKTAVQHWREELRQYRRLPLPWIFNPLAWHARIHRNAAHDGCKELLKSALTTRHWSGRKPDELPVLS
jgi:glycosyltransferase involved in cell wall biosynthesis